MKFLNILFLFVTCVLGSSVFAQDFNAEEICGLVEQVITEPGSDVVYSEYRGLNNPIAVTLRIVGTSNHPAQEPVTLEIPREYLNFAKEAEGQTDLLFCEIRSYSPNIKPRAYVKGF